MELDTGILLTGNSEPRPPSIFTRCGVSLPGVTDLHLRIQKMPQDEKILRHVPELAMEAITKDNYLNTISEMVFRMYAMGGVGLAANQVGLPENLFVMDTDWLNRHELKPYVCIEPHIVDYSEELIESEEGCLSCNNVIMPLKRHAEVQLTYTDLNGDRQSENFTGLASCCVQHEVDHLNGKLIIDGASRLMLDILKRKGKKRKKQAVRKAKKE